MLVRWQGDGMVSNPVAYDLGAFTGVHVPAPASAWQRGLQPENAGAATPGVQLNGYHGGMLINTWAVPHRTIEGGGYNDMYGYAWSPGRRPDAFVLHNSFGAPVGPIQLVLQASLAVPSFTSWAFVNNSWTSPGPDEQSGQLSLFAYLEDGRHPGLPPIVIVATAWDHRLAGDPCGRSTGFVGFDYPTGVWFGSSYMCTTDITTAFFTAASQQALFSDERFFRIHITPANWANLIGRINSAGPGNADHSLQCTPGSTCPPTGYSNDPSDYRIQYAGVIAEAGLIENGATKMDTPFRQALMGADIYGVGVYQSR
jgi:hypothetical protein